MITLGFIGLIFVVCVLASLRGALQPKVQLSLCALVTFSGLGIFSGLQAQLPWYGSLGMLLSVGAMLPCFLCAFLGQNPTLRVWLATVASLVGVLVVFAASDATLEVASVVQAMGGLILLFSCFVSGALLSDARAAFNALMSFRAHALTRSVGLAFCLAAVLCSCLPSVAFAHVVGLSASFSVAAGVTYTVVREPYLLLSYSVRKLLAAHPEVSAEQVRSLLAGVGCLLEGDAPVDLWIGDAGQSQSIRLSSSALIPALHDQEVPEGWQLGTAFALRQMQSDATHLLTGLQGSESLPGGLRPLTEGLELSSVRPIVEFAQDKARRYFGNEILTASASMQSLLFKAVEQAAQSQWFLLSGEQGVGRTAVARVIARKRQQEELLFFDCANQTERQTIAYTVNEVTHTSGAGRIGLLCSGLDGLSEHELTHVLKDLLALPSTVAVYFRVSSESVHTILQRLALMENVPQLSVFDIPGLKHRPIDSLLQFCRFIDEESRTQHKPVHRLESSALLEALQTAAVGNSSALKEAAATAVAQSVAGVVWTTGVPLAGERV